MPGMIDTHRHMWQTALRGYGADWTLAQYFVFFYLEWGKIFRPQDIHAGNLLSAIESLDAGVTTTVDWSHGLQTVDHADAAVDALEAVPGRFVLAYGNIQQGPWEWATSKDFRSFVERRFGPRDDMLGFQMAFDVTGDPEFPEKAAFEVARELGVPVTTHAGRVGRDQRRRHPADARARLHGAGAHLRARRDADEDSYHRIAATGGSVSVSTESEQSAGQGYPPTWQLRKHGIPVSLSMDTSVWWSGDLFCAMRATLGADRSREHLEAHAQAGDGHQPPPARRAGRRLGDARRQQGARAATRRSAASRRARRPTSCSSRTSTRRSMFPILHPYGHVAFQAQRGDVHTVLVNGRVVKHDGRLVGIDLARGAARGRGDRRVRRSASSATTRGRAGMHPEIPETGSSTTRTSTRSGTRRCNGSDEHDRAADARGGASCRDALAALHEVLERHRVTEEEWTPALALPDRGRPRGRVRPALGRDAHVGADRRACRTAATRRRDGERRRGPALPSTTRRGARRR